MNGEEKLKAKLKDRWWRLNNLYYIRDKQGKKVLFRLNEAQAALYDNLWYFNVILKARQLGFCLDPNTRILTADLTWIKIKDAQIGQQIVAVDEYPLEKGKGHQRKMRTGVVQGVVKVEREAFELEFDNGDKLICTERHPWLGRKAATDSKWMNIAGSNGRSKLNVGDKIRTITKPWEGQTRPSRMLGNHFWEGKELPSKGIKGDPWRTVVGIKSLGERSLIDLQTSTGTYIAEGYVSHNTTFTMIYFLDACLFRANHMAGVVAHTRLDAEDLFKNKIKFAYDNLPEWLKKAVPASTDSARELALGNGSSIVVGTSLRSGTFQKLLISEYGKVSAKYPDKAKEIKTGALNTVDQGQQIFVESTAEGQAGEFYDLCQSARRLADEGKELVSMEPRFHFFPWSKNKEYTLNDHHLIKITSKQDEYLKSLGDLTDGQRAWYVAKLDTMGFEMRREYPSTPDEAFEGSTEGAYYLDEMAAARRENRIRKIPYNQTYGVYTFWDIGQRDLMTIWFGQWYDGEMHFIDYHESSGHGWKYYGELLKGKEYNYLMHLFPHDGNQRVQGEEVVERKKLAENQGITPVRVVPRTKSAHDDVRNYCKPAFHITNFDSRRCVVGINHLDNYRKKWDRTVGMYMNEHRHDEASHGADSFRTFAAAWKQGLMNIKKRQTGKTGAGLKTVKRFQNKNKVLKSRR